MTARLARASERPAAAPDRHHGPWSLVEENTGTTVSRRTGPVAGAQLSEDGGGVRIQFWFDGGPLPHELRRELARSVLRHRAVRPGIPVNVALPCGEYEVLDELRSHLRDVRAHVAGATCLLDGRVR